jgi:hypothetical protein
LQCSAANQLAAVSEGQLLGRLGKFLIADDNALRAAVVACAGDNLLDSRDADGLAVALALDRHRLTVAFGDQVDAVVATR